MHRAFGLNIPQTLEEVCDPNRLALIVYDMQVGIVKQIEHAKPVTDKVLQVLEAARAAHVRVFHTRHMSLPKELMGVSQFRMAMAWQRLQSADDVKPWFLRDSPGFRLIPEVNPLPSEPSSTKSPCPRLKVRRSIWHCAIARSPRLPLLALPWKLVSNRRYGTART